METEVLEAIQRFDLINKSASQFKDWRTIRKALSEALKPSHNTQSTQLCDDCATNKVAVSVCEPCLLKMINRGA